MFANIILLLIWVIPIYNTIYWFNRFIHCSKGLNVGYAIIIGLLSIIPIIGIITLLLHFEYIDIYVNDISNKCEIDSYHIHIPFYKQLMSILKHNIKHNE